MRAAHPAFRFTGLIAPVVLCSSAAAQTLELSLREESSLSPIAGAIVRLVDAKGTSAQGLTNEAGRLVLRAPTPGAYRIKIDRIGWSGLVTESFELGHDQTVRREIRMASRRLELPALVVGARTPCDPGAKGGELASVLWEEVRKALTANVLTQRARAIPLHAREFVREVSLTGQPLREWVVLSTIVRGSPFHSLPASELGRNGFIREEGDSLDFAAPDAATLLSDEFVVTHCFNAVQGSDRLAGLAFEPVRGRRVPDVAGILWVDPSTDELRFLEYSYTRLEGLLRGAALGGRVEFERLSNGNWIVSYWHIRMPRLESRRVALAQGGGQVSRLAGYLDRGGRAKVAADTLGRIDRAIVRGRVYDSTSGRGLARAFVSVLGTTDSVLVDDDGRFELAVAASGDQVVAARHPKLGLLGEATTRAALLSVGDTTQTLFAVPPLTAFVRSLCRNRADNVAIVGMVWNPQGEPATGREVRAMKRTVRGDVFLEPTPPPTDASSSTRSDKRGLFGLCNLPPKGTVQVITVESGQIRVEVPVPLQGESRWVDVREWGRADTTIISASTIQRIAARAVMTGSVHRDSSGLPLARVEVLLEGSNRQTTTDAAGRYLLGDLPSGDHVALFRLVGYRPVRVGVHLAGGDTARADAAMVRAGAQELEPVEVKGRPSEPRGFGREAFEERRRMGFGKFIDSAVLRRSENRRVSDVLRGIPGLNVVRFRDCIDPKRCGPVEERAASSRGEISLIRGGRDAYGWMSVILDGNYLYRAGSSSPPPDLRRDLQVADLESIEVYRSAAELPSEFSGTVAACGVIVLWSRRG